MGEERILRGELIYTFNYLGSTPLLGDAFRFSTRALGAAALASPSQGCCSTAGIDLGLGACHCSSERCWCFFSFSFCHNECNARSVSGEFTTSSCHASWAQRRATVRCGKEAAGGGRWVHVRRQAAKFCQIAGNWEVATIMAPFLLFPNHTFGLIYAFFSQIGWTVPGCSAEAGWCWCCNSADFSGSAPHLQQDEIRLCLGEKEEEIIQN